MKKTIGLTLICLSFAMGTGSAQSDTTLVAKNMELARRLMDGGLYDESIALLDDADAFDPARTYIYSYEKAFANYLKGDYAAAIRLLGRALRFRDASDSAYRMLGDCYILTGDEAGLAFQTYISGLQKFPDSGRLYYGVGMIHFNDGAYDLALDAFLEGIERDPAYTDNWFAATVVNFTSDGKIFGMINGETAVCLEPDSERSGVIRQVLMEAYRESITFPEGSVAQVSFSSNGTASVRDRSGSDDSATSFPVAYETILSRSAAGARATDIPSLIDIRRRFIEAWFSAELHLGYPCALFDFHRALIGAGHFEAYNYWLFSPDDPTVFAAWHLTEAEAFDAFREWLDQNPIFEP